MKSKSAFFESLKMRMTVFERGSRLVEEINNNGLRKNETSQISKLEQTKKK